jgi:GrpB-like predicted nucleotidyltransferase (UPF0157 family)
MKPVEKTNVEVVAYNPSWPDIYKAERDIILAASPQFVVIEHVGSTAVPGQAAKPIIDMMAAVENLQEVEVLLESLTNLDYHLFDAGMRNRLFLRKRAKHGQVFHLHIVQYDTWDERKERLMRDYLLAHPEAVQAYADLKRALASRYPEDSTAYTKAKTEFIQGVIDKARTDLGLPRVSVWED